MCNSNTRNKNVGEALPKPAIWQQTCPHGLCSSTLEIQGVSWRVRAAGCETCWPKWRISPFHETAWKQPPLSTGGRWEKLFSHPHKLQFSSPQVAVTPKSWSPPWGHTSKKLPRRQLAEDRVGDMALSTPLTEKPHTSVSPFGVTLMTSYRELLMISKS